MEDFIAFIINGYAIYIIIYLIDNDMATVKPQLIIQYTDVNVSKPSVFAVIFRVFALTIVLLSTLKV